MNNHKNDQNKIFELLGEYLHAFEIHGLEVRIEELESKFSKDLSETTFNEINDLKEEKKGKTSIKTIKKYMDFFKIALI